jgi:arginyl-tRNA synthetase
MADPILTLNRAFASAIGAAFGAEHAGTDPALRRSQHADFQANAAMALGKKVGRPPREVATAIMKELRLEGVCSKVEIAGPGFINLVLDEAYLARELTDAASAPALGVPRAAAPEKVVVDYSSPNAAKEMHVGHLRSTIIGDSIARTLDALGHTVVRQNHLGDWGTPFGMLIEHLLDLDQTGAVDQSASDLNAFYKTARAKFDAEPAFAERSRQRVVKLQGGDEDTLGLWRRLVGGSIRYFTAAYQRMGVLLQPEDVAGESLYNPMLADTAAQLEAKGLARISDGALCVFPEGFTGREGEPLPLIVRKGDGGYGYAATDLSAIRYRTEKLGATRLVYVVGAPQSQHFAMVFAVAKMAGWLAPPARAEHVAFGSILGPDKKMFKTRSGDTVKLTDLLDEAFERALKEVKEKSPDIGEEAQIRVAHAVGAGAVKYADLSSDRIKDYVFDWDRMLAFEGNTAPYLMYAHARIRSIFRKGAVDDAALGPMVVKAPQEKRLAMEILRYGAVVAEVGETLQPHRLCLYLFELAQAYTSFHENCPVLKAPTDEERRSRLAMCDLTAKVLAAGLGLLGITAPERM